MLKMNIKKITKGTLLSSFVYITISLVTNKVLPEDVAIVVSNTLNKANILVISIMSGITYLICSYRLPIISDNDIPMKKFEYFYNQSEKKLQEELDLLSYENKMKYVESTESILSQQKRNALNNYIFTLTTPQKSKFTKFLSRIISITFIFYISYVGYDIYVNMQPLIEKYNEEMNATYDDQTLYIDGLPLIQLLGDNEFRQHTIDNFIADNIKPQATFLLNNCKVITISNHRNQELIWADSQNAGDGLGARAFSNLLEKHIYIESTDEFETITHELSHLYDFSNGYLISDTDEFQNLYVSYKGTFRFPEVDNDYCNGSSIEFFAESSQLYVNNPDYLEKNCKPLYDYFSNLYS